MAEVYMRLYAKFLATMRLPYCNKHISYHCRYYLVVKLKAKVVVVVVVYDEDETDLRL
jgi:hypothetical protein